MKTTILIVEDDIINRKVLHNILKNEYEIIEAENGVRALELLSDSHNAVSLVLLDLGMPVMDGYATLAEIRKNPKFSSLPVIITTASTETGAEIKALSMGANDYIIKPYTPRIIINRIRNTIKFYESAALINYITKDKLTGLYNREGFFDEATKRIRAHEPGYYVLSCMDIDSFKVINDLYGTEKGDSVLRHIADTFKKGFDIMDGICGRLSADDFVALYPRGSMDSEELEEIRRVASRPDVTMPQLFIKTGRYLVDNLSLSLSAMYDRTILALQSVKGRHDVHIAHYTESMREMVLHYQAIINDMNRALKDGEFEAWFQPQFNHATGTLIGAEALVRWRHAERGIIPPCEFIPVFENNGFIYEMDKCIWERVCECLRRWIDEKRSPLPVSVNISRYDLLRDDVVEVLVGLLGRYNIPVELLRLEITESAFTNTPEQIVGIVRRFIEHGFTVEIDDFGSGYSSLNTLKDVPAHILKLDMRFLKGGETDRGGNILESIVRMSKWLNMPVIAEGVETLAQADFLKSIGCSYVQGYLYARPMPVQEYEALMGASRSEEKLIAIEALARIDNNAFWNPDSMDSIIFSSYVGSACVFEYYRGKMELLRATDKYIQMFGPGMTIEKALKLDWDAYFDEKSRQTVREALELSQSTGNEAIAEYVFLNLPGCRKETCLRSTLRVLAITGDRRLVYCINENITAQREAERKEAESTKRLAAIMDNMDDGVSAITIDDGIVHFVFTNERYYSILGYTRVQFDAEVHNAFELIHPDDRERIQNVIADVLQSGEKASCEYRCIQCNGNIVHLRCNIADTELAGIRDRVLLSVTSDITDAVATGRRLAETGGQLKFLNDVAQDLLAQPEVDEGINRVLGKVLDYFGGDRAYVSEMDSSRLTARNTYEIRAQGVAGERNRFQNLSRECAPCLWATLDGGSYINIQEVSSPGGERSDERFLLEQQGIRSLVAVPLKRDGEVIGFVGVDNPVRQQNHVEHLRAIGDYLTVMLTRRDLTAALNTPTR